MRAAIDTEGEGEEDAKEDDVREDEKNVGVRLERTNTRGEKGEARIANSDRVGGMEGAGDFPGLKGG